MDSPIPGPPNKRAVLFTRSARRKDGTIVGHSGDKTVEIKADGSYRATNRRTGKVTFGRWRQS
jgi:hypothetical protein